MLYDVLITDYVSQWGFKAVKLSKLEAKSLVKRLCDGFAFGRRSGRSDLTAFYCPHGEYSAADVQVLPDCIVGQDERQALRVSALTADERAAAGLPALALHRASSKRSALSGLLLSGGSVGLE